MAKKKTEVRISIVVNPAFTEQFKIVTKEAKKLEKIKPFLEVFTDK